LIDTWIGDIRSVTNFRNGSVSQRFLPSIFGFHLFSHFPAICETEMNWYNSKQVDALYRYSSFGEENSTGTLASPWRFSSKRFDPETGLIYFGRRYYSPQLGIWITPDPAGYTDGINRYAFVHNNPLSHRDLYGLRDVCDWTPDSDYDQRTGIREYDYFDPEKHHQHDRDANDPEECNLQRNIIMPTIAILTESCLPSTHDLETDFFRYEPNEFQARSVCQQNLDFGEAVSCFFVEETIVGGQIGKMAIKGIGWAAKAVRGVAKNIIPQLGERGVTLVNRGASFAGCRRLPFKYAPYQEIRNQAAIINGRKYSGHALDKMQDRGFMPTCIESALKTSQTFPTKTGTIGYYDSVNNVRVIVNSKTGQVVTTIPGPPK